METGRARGGDWAPVDSLLATGRRVEQAMYPSLSHMAQWLSGKIDTTVLLRTFKAITVQSKRSKMFTNE